MQRETLILEDESEFSGFVFGASTNATDEVIFQTGMVGYIELLTDPSYCRQILVLIFPLIGNYDVPDEKAVDDFGIQRWIESNKIYASGLILKKHNVPGLYGIDTRMLTKNLREYRTILGKIIMKGTDPASIPFQDLNIDNLMIQVSIQKPYIINPTGKISIACINCGMKNNQLRILCQLEFDGLFLSSDPGDPQTQYPETITIIESWITSETIKPVFGIGLEHQALAAGMKIIKLKYGNRGIIHDSKPFFSVQFYPEYCAGPRDTENLFQIFLDVIQSYKSTKSINVETYLVEQLTKHSSTDNAPLPAFYKRVKRVLILENNQVIKAINEDNVYTVVLNQSTSIPQTAKDLLSKVYPFSIIPNYVEQILRIHRPDGILLSFDEETALHCGVHLHESGILQKYSCNVLETLIQSIQSITDQCLFTQEMADIGEKVVSYEVVKSLEETLISAERFDHPVLVCATFPEGDRISGYTDNRKELISLVTSILAGLSQSLIDKSQSLIDKSQSSIDKSKLLIDKSFKDWRKIEYEVVRKQYNNCIVICNMENIDPLSCCTDHSIVVASNQTLSNDEYNLLRSVSIKFIHHLGLSRLSALASKTTGYPLAYITVKLAFGLNLAELINNITNQTCACFEPSLDYVVIKISKWNLDKYDQCSNKTESSSTTAIRHRYIIEHLYGLTKINRWFLYKFETILKFIFTCTDRLVGAKKLFLFQAKHLGFSNQQLANCLDMFEAEVFQACEQCGIRPFMKQIDTVFGE
ncbi:unnamed protein product [Rotaria sordida]|uniref:Uncharacterized protein n=1 Tax=Rotaria sordida TaxID=392033 RepID=A0A814DCJ4_9BILA|nr:unnamed protein product [Rotaria sordida]